MLLYFYFLQCNNQCCKLRPTDLTVRTVNHHHINTHEGSRGSGRTVAAAERVHSRWICCSFNRISRGSDRVLSKHSASQGGLKPLESLRCMLEDIMPLMGNSNHLTLRIRPPFHISCFVISFFYILQVKQGECDVLPGIKPQVFSCHFFADSY